MVLLRGVNVGGHRRFRPSVLAKELTNLDVVSVGAAGTFVVRKPCPRELLRTALLEKLPFQTHIVFCDGDEFIRLEASNPFGNTPAAPDIVRFASFLADDVRSRPILPVALPASGEWYVRILALRTRIAIGEYRRHMKTIAFLGQVDTLFGVPATTRNWNTISAIVRVLKDER